MSKRPFKNVCLLALCFVLPQFLNSQEVPPTLFVEEGQKQVAMLLSKLEVNVKILGSISETRMTMTFHNPNNRQLSGDLYFPLPEGAFISGYALDINNKMIDGVVVEKAKGRQVFEALTRQRIDPGLVEWVKGNNFKTRVFPLPPNGDRTVMVRYISELVDNPEGTFFLLPLKYKGRIKEFILRIEVLKEDVPPKVKRSGFANFDFRKWRENYVAEIRLKDEALDKDLILELPGGARPKVMVEKTPEGKYYFLISDHPQKPADLKTGAPAPPKDIVIFWDASLSRAKASHERELQILRKVLAQWKETTVDVELVTFNNEPDLPKTFSAKNGNAEDLADALKKTAYDGGTQVGALRPLENRKKPDLYFLFSDGLSNFNKEDPPLFNAPLYAFSDDSSANHPFLHDLAGRNRGEYFNLKKLTDEEVLVRIGRPTFSFIRTDASQPQIEETFPRNPKPADGRFLLAGRLTGEEAKVNLHFGVGGKTLVQLDHVIREADAVEGELLQKFWAQKKIEELMVSARRNEKELTETGQAFGLVTPGTSLIVLDNLNQYVEYRIPPPKSLPEMRRRYFDIIEKQASELKLFEQEKIDTVLKWWNERIAWWSTDFMITREEKTAEKKAAEPEPVQRQGQITSVPPRRNPRLTGPGIEGKITDQDDNPIPGVTIGLSLRERSWQQVSDESGYFAFADIPAGSFKLRAELAGFNTTIVNNILFNNDRKRIVNVVMAFSSIEEQVTVTAASPVVDARVAKKGGPSETEEPKITLQPWDPKTPYLEELKKADPGKAYETYLGQREKYGDSPGFYLDCADHFFSAGRKDLGLRILTNISELELENGQLLRILGHRLEQLELRELAASVFEDVVRLRPEEPQSYRDLALVMASMEKYERAIELLNHVVMSKWDRFPQIEVIALMEMNDIMAKAKKAGIKQFKVSPQLIKLLDVDIRIILTWDADNTDIDLWVIEPTEEKAFYSHNQTSIGGLMSSDVTDGYGPEEYLLRKAMPGKYKVQINYYGSRTATLTGPVMVQVDIFTNYGRPNEQHKAVTMRLTDVKEVSTVTEIEY